MLTLQNRIYTLISNIRKHRALKITRSAVGEYKEATLIRHLLINHYGLSKVSYLELGCNDPVVASSTYSYYKEGYCGVCIDANPSYAQRYKQIRPGDTFVNAGITGDEDGEEKDFYVTSDKVSSTFDKNWLETVLAANPTCKIEKTIKVKLRNINSIMDEHFESTPDFLLIDLEGLDFTVLKSLDFDKHRPKVIMIETLVLTTNRNKQLDNFRKIAKFLATKEYHWVFICGINGIFADKAQFKRKSLLRLV